MAQKVYKLINAQQSQASQGEKVKVSITDAQSDYLQNKLEAGDSITIDTINPGGNEKLLISVDPTTIDHNDLNNKGTKTHDQLEQDIDDLYEELTKYTATFNDTTDWTLNGDYYELSIPEATHNRGSHVFIVVMDLNGDWIDTAINTDNNGDVTISIASTPDLRFAGRLTIY